MPSRSAPSASRALSGSSSSQSGACDAATRASVARFACPDESSRTGTSSSWAMPSASIASSTGPAQKESARHSGSSRSSARLSSASASATRSTRPRSARRSPAASRIKLDLPLPFGPATCSPSPGPSSRFMASKSKPPAAAERHVFEAQQARHCHAVFERMHVRRRLSRNDGRLHGSARGRRDVRGVSSPVGPFVEYRPPEQPNALRQSARTGRHFAPSKECLRTPRSAAKASSMPSAASVSSIGEFLYREDDVADAFRERLRAAH